MSGKVVIAFAIEHGGAKGPCLEIREYPREIGRDVYSCHAAIFIGEGVDIKWIGKLLAAAVEIKGVRYISATARRICLRKGIAVPVCLTVVPLSI
ncbi:hypothetical protein A3F28_01850 [Candidatus Uhrbacteria bacterium RIFCSPHIGHO2_12_FULL_57_11]|uniref:Uncharacterized protein n=2 Tax=Candidatus Uhriibacteriota TaxID=1752732 RepID=A0A1F7UM78_9BACT|nr:MAG: hypothetical protein A3D72_02815 [Candidatus Uhrbacteria bacterium RIFCSPHIGHO2_02_FULL_57_19]OGL79391.1 MAG: hypothetical protein A3F28_01850 [Candidatus Uhrbacteria bacterium RIFCSPHIGHO2_12_FULL_57_11]